MLCSPTSELLSRFFVAESLEKSTQDLEILGISRTGCPKKGRLWKLTRHRYGRGWKNMMWSVVSWLVSIAETWGHFMIHHVKDESSLLGFSSFFRTFSKKLSGFWHCLGLKGMWHVLHFHPSCFSTHRPCCTSLQRVSVRCGWYGQAD